MDKTLTFEVKGIFVDGYMPLAKETLLEKLTKRLNEAGYVFRQVLATDGRHVICVMCNNAIEVARADVQNGLVTIVVPNEEQSDAVKFVKNFLDKYVL